MSESVLLDIKDLHVWYKVFGGTLRVLDGVNVTVHEGEKVALVGETGCGKTITVKAILRILPERDTLIPRGEILFNGRDVLKMNRRELQRVRSGEIAMIFQDPTAALNPVFSVGVQVQDVVRYSSAHSHRGRRTAREVTLRALKEVSLPDQERMLGNYPIQLSGGMRQRVCISMAMTTHRQLLIADEPGTSLDVTIQDQILHLLRELVDKQGTSIILITHSLGVARELADRIYVMYAGNVVEVAHSAELFAAPLHPYTRGLVASVPKLTGEGISPGIPGRIPSYLEPPSGCRFHPRCAQAMTECSQEKPPLYGTTGDRQVACFLFKG
jgi:peptide/nickel transport system ATP-binding protein